MAKNEYISSYLGKRIGIITKINSEEKIVSENFWGESGVSKIKENLTIEGILGGETETLLNLEDIRVKAGRYNTIETSSFGSLPKNNIGILYIIKE